MKPSLAAASVLLAILAAIIAVTAWFPSRPSHGIATRLRSAQEAQTLPPERLESPRGDSIRSPVTTGSRLGIANEDGLPVWCEDQSGEPVEGAEIWVVIPAKKEAKILAGRTDARGGTTLSETVGASSTEVAIEARHASYLTQQVTVDPTSTSVHIVLEHGAQLSGTVVLASGNSALAGVHVLAHPRGELPSKETVTAAVAGRDQSLAITVSEADGTFSLSGLEFGREYVLHAGGPGYISRAGIPQVQAPSAGLVVTVDGLYGARVSLRDPDHGSLPSKSTLAWSPPGPQWFWDDDGEFHGVPADAINVVLAGVPVEDTGRRASSTHLLLFACSTEVESVGPILYRGHLAGYEAFEARVFAPRLVEQIPRQEVSLTPVVEDWGALEVEYLWPGGAKPTAPILHDSVVSRLFVAHLTLGKTYEVRNYQLPGQSSRIDRLPAGPYVVSYAVGTSAHVHAGETGRGFHCDVSDQGVAKLEIDLRELCSITIELGQDDSEYSGPIQLGIQGESNPDAIPIVQLRRKPYIIQGLPADRYRVFAYKPFHPGGTPWHDVRQHSHDGSSATIRLGE